MKIAMIGAGAIGGNLARLFSSVGYEVAISNSRGPDSLTALASSIGVIPATAEDAVQSDTCQRGKHEASKGDAPESPAPLRVADGGRTG